MRKITLPQGCLINVDSKFKEKFSEPLSQQLILVNLNPSLKVFRKEGPGYYQLYWDYDLVAEVNNTSNCFFYKGRLIDGKIISRSPFIRVYEDAESGQSH